VNHLFKKADRGENFDYLSGLLIGLELKETKSEIFDLITVVSSADLLAKYLYALKVLGVSHKVKGVEAAEVIVKGHCKIFSTLQ
jgi:2-keto-3-deoxy-galactonokinase